MVIADFLLTPIRRFRHYFRVFYENPVDYVLDGPLTSRLLIIETAENADIVD